MQYRTQLRVAMGICLCLILVAAGCGSSGTSTTPRKFTYVSALDKSGNTTFERPSGWKDVSTDTKAQYSDASESGCTLFTSTTQAFIKGGGYSSKEGYLMSLQTAWKQQVSGKIEMTGPTTLAGREATQSVATVNINGVPSRTWQVIAEGPEGDLARVAYTCPLVAYDANLPAMRQALESFTFG